MSKLTDYTRTSLVPEPRSPRSHPTTHFHPDPYEAPKGRKDRLLNLPQTHQVSPFYTSHLPLAWGWTKACSPSHMRGRAGHPWLSDHCWSLSALDLLFAKGPALVLDLAPLLFPLLAQGSLLHLFWLIMCKWHSRDLGWHHTAILGHHVHTVYSKSLPETGNCSWWLEVART